MIWLLVFSTYLTCCLVAFTAIGGLAMLLDIAAVWWDEWQASKDEPVARVVRR